MFGWLSSLFEGEDSCLDKVAEIRWLQKKEENLFCQRIALDVGLELMKAGDMDGGAVARRIADAIEARRGSA
jgi:hypothetical protein